MTQRDLITHFDGGDLLIRKIGGPWNFISLNTIQRVTFSSTTIKFEYGTQVTEFDNVRGVKALINKLSTHKLVKDNAAFRKVTAPYRGPIYATC